MTIQYPKSIHSIKYALLLSLLFSNTITQAQHKRKPGSGWELNPVIGAGVSDIVFKNNDAALYFRHSSPRFNTPLGCHIGYKLNSHFGIFTGVHYQPANWLTRRYESFPYNTEETIASNGYLQLPIFLRAVSSRPGKVGLTMDAGLRFGKLVRVKEQLSYSETPERNEVRTVNNSYNTYYRMVHVSIGVSIPFSARTAMNAGVYIQRGGKHLLNNEWPYECAFAAAGGYLSASILL